jgi:hypothetical protein
MAIPKYGNYTFVPAPSLSSSASYYASMSDSQLKALSYAEIKAITAAQVAAMSSAQIGLFSSFDWFSPAAFAGLAAEDMPFVTIASQKGGTWAYMSAEQVANLSPSAFAALSKSQLQSLTYDAIKGITAAQISALSKEQIGWFNSFDWLSPAAFAGLTDEDMPFVTTAGQKGGSWQYMSPQQVGNLSPSAFAALSKSQLQSLTYDVIKGITAAQITALSKEQIGWFNSFDWFSPAAFAGLAAEDMPYVATGDVMGGSWQYMSAEQVANLSPSAIAALSQKQLQSLKSSAIVGITAAQVAALTPIAVASLFKSQLQSLTYDAIKGITAAQISALSQRQIGWFNYFDWLSPAAFAGLGADDVPFVTTYGQKGGSWEFMSAEQVANLSPSAIAALSQTQLQSLKSSAIGAITAAQVAALTPIAVASLFKSQLQSLTSDAIKGITAAQISALSKEQIGWFNSFDWFSPAAFAGLGAEDMPFVTTDDQKGGSWQNMRATQVACLSPSALAAMSTSQLQSLTRPVIETLSPYQIQALTISQMAALTSLQIEALTRLQIHYLTHQQIRAITPAAVAFFTADELKTPDLSQIPILVDLIAPQIGKLTASQFKILSAQDIQQISTTAISGLTPTQAAYTDASGKTVLSELTAAQLSAYQLAQSMAGGSKAAAITSSTTNGSTVNQFQLTIPK